MRFREFPSDLSGVYESLDPRNLYQMPFRGAYVERYEGVSQPIYDYLPESLIQSHGVVYVFAPEGADPETFLEEGGWVRLAEEKGVMLMLFVPPTGGYRAWSFDEIKKVLFTQGIHKYYNIQFQFRYLVGYGDGARAVLEQALSTPVEWAGVVLSGEYADAKELIAASKVADETRPRKSQDMPLPIWIFRNEADEGADALIEYFCAANKTEPDPYQKDGVSYYLPDARKYYDSVNDAPIARVLVSDRLCENREGDTEKLFRDFLLTTTRNRVITDSGLHPYRSMEDWGAVSKTIEIDGYTREYLEYVPEYVREHPEYKTPLLVYLHGRSNTCVTNSYTTEWFNVAKARNFMIVSLSGSFNRSDKEIPIPHWNIFRDPNLYDDMKFIRTLTEKTIRDYNVDRSRVYLSGFSMGGMMTQEVSLVMPDLFAAAAVNAGVLPFPGAIPLSVNKPDVREDLDMPLFIQMGQFDILPQGGRLGSDPLAEANIYYWVDRYKLVDKEAPGTYKSGPFNVTVFHDQDNVPMLTYIVTDNKPHACVPYDSWIYYDQFFAKFSRDENGDVYYLGKKVRRSH